MRPKPNKNNPPSSVQSTKRTASSGGIEWLSLKKYLSGDTRSLKWIFWGIAGVALSWMLFTSQMTGINADDKMQNEYEQSLMRWYSTGGEDSTALNLPQTKMHYYGGLFEVITGATNRIAGNPSPDDLGYHQVRHAWNAVFGWQLILFIGLTAWQFAGWRAGIIALLMAFLSPRLVGHGVMNPKDIPFATGYIISLFFIFRWMFQMPKPSWQTLVGLTLGLGMAIGVRAGGILLVAIFALFAFLHFLGRFGVNGVFRGKELGRYLLYGLIPVLGGFLVALAFWPFAMQAPFDHIREAMAELEKYGVNIRLLFNGEMVFAQSLPWDYLPMWVLVTVPLFILVGWLIGLLQISVLWKRYGSIAIGMLLFAFLFPFIYVIYKGSTLYDGWRHLIFPYTSGVVLAALALHALDDWASARWKPHLVLYLIGILAISPLMHMVRNPAHQYIYFNPIVGGVKGAYGNYETDYWGTSVKQGLEWLEKEGIIGPDIQTEVTIASNFAYALQVYGKKYGPNVKFAYVRYRQRHDEPWDYGLFQSRFVDASYIKKGSWPPENTIHTIDVDGAPILAIAKNTDDLGFRGVKAQKENRFEEAILLLEELVKREPLDEVAWTSLAFSYMNTGNVEACKKALDRIFEIEPESVAAMNYSGMLYTNTGEFDKAADFFEKSLKIQENNFFAFFYLASIELERKNLSKALEYGKKAITSNNTFKGSYELVANIYDAMGDPGNATAYRNAAAKM